MNTKADLSTGDVVVWLRQQAVWFNVMAEDIERRFSMKNLTSQVHVSDVKALLGGRSLRPAQIAQRLNVTVDDLDELIIAKNGFTKNGRGWVSEVPKGVVNGEIEKEVAGRPETRVQTDDETAEPIRSDNRQA